MRLFILFFSLGCALASGVSECRSDYSRLVPVEALRSSEILRIVAEARAAHPSVQYHSEYSTGLNQANRQTADEVKTRIEGRLKDAGYEITGTLGEGGLGTVFLAKKDGKTFALKALKRVTSKDSKALVEEASLMARVADTRGPKEQQYFLDGKIVRLPKVADLTAEPVIEMEYFEGAKTLHDLILSGYFKKDPGAVEEVSRQLMAAMEKAHGTGVIHSDLKPGNVLVRVNPDHSLDVRVIDWGLGARTRESGGSGRSALYSPGGSLGTPAYMSKGQWTSELAAPGFDIHALRIIDHQMRSGDLRSAEDSSVVRHITPQFSFASPARALDHGDSTPVRDRRLISAEWSSLPRTIAERQELIRRARNDRESDYLAWYGKKLESIDATEAAADLLASRYLSDNLALLKIDGRKLDLIVQAAYVKWVRSDKLSSSGASLGYLDPAPNLFFQEFDQSVRALHGKGDLFSPESYRVRAGQLLRLAEG